MEELPFSIAAEAVPLKLQETAGRPKSGCRPRSLAAERKRRALWANSLRALYIYLKAARFERG